MGDEFFYIDTDGKKADADLHEKILADGDREKAQAVTRKRLIAQGVLTPEEIEAFLSKD